MLYRLPHEPLACTCPRDMASDTFSSMIFQTRKMQVHNMETLAQRRSDLHHSRYTLRNSHPCICLQRKRPPQRHQPSLPLQSQRAGKRFALTCSGSTQRDTNGKCSLQKTCQLGTESQTCDCQRLDSHLELARMLLSLACQNTGLRHILHTLKHLRP